MSDTITIDDFAKMDLRVGTITNAESIPKSKLLKLSVSFGNEIGTKTVLAGIAKLPLDGNRWMPTPLVITGYWSLPPPWG